MRTQTICVFFRCEICQDSNLGQHVSYRSIRLGEVVHGDGEEDVEQDVVAADKQNDEVETEQESETLQRKGSL